MPSSPDRLSPLLNLFALRAGTFYAGAICSIQPFEADPLQGHLHLVMRGPLTWVDSDGRRLSFDEPTVVFMPRPSAHQLLVDERAGADVVCANVHFGTEGRNPISLSLPHVLVVPPGGPALVGLMADEAFADRDGRQASLDRLCELLLIQLIRHALNQGLVAHGLLAGMLDPALCKALEALHQDPAHPWTLSSLAHQAGMSRTAFAVHFKAVVGETPMGFLTQWRVALAQQGLRQGCPLKRVAHEVGYASASALSKAFVRELGQAPLQWLRTQTLAS